MAMRRIFIFGIIIFLISTKGYSRIQEEISKEIKKKVISTSQKKAFLNLINTAYAETIKKSEKKVLRKEWKKMLGIDIFYPYFKAKEVERWIKEKASIYLFKIKGEPSFRKDKVRYIFKIKF